MTLHFLVLTGRQVLGVSWIVMYSLDWFGDFNEMMGFCLSIFRLSKILRIFTHSFCFMSQCGVVLVHAGWKICKKWYIIIHFESYNWRSRKGARFSNGWKFPFQFVSFVHLQFMHICFVPVWAYVLWQSMHWLYTHRYIYIYIMGGTDSSEFPGKSKARRNNTYKIEGSRVHPITRFLPNRFWCWSCPANWR